MNLKEFSNPPKQYRPLPLWEWNAEIESSEVETQVRDLYKKGFGGFFIHAANGLKTKYLGDDWMKVFRRAVEVAGELKIEAWFCDEDRSPSGHAGGTTTLENEDLVKTFLIWEPDASKADISSNCSIITYTLKTADNRVTTTIQKPENLSDAGIFYIKKNLIFAPQFNGGNYPDLMNPVAVKNFIENTYEKYLKLFRYDFGEYLPGVLSEISSEASLINSEDKVCLPWSESLAEYFEKTFGYPLTENLHLLFSDDDNFKFRNDFYHALTGLFANSFTIPIRDWCREKGLMFAGLFNNNCLNMLSQYKNTDILAVEAPASGKTDITTIKELQSIANQLGKKRIIGRILQSEGNGCTFDDIRRTIDYLSALGVNSISPVNMRYSLIGVSKEDYSPSLSYHHPGWEKIRALTDYAARNSWAVSQGKSAVRITMLSPIESSSSIVIGDEPGHEDVVKTYSSLVKALIEEQIEFDICQESVLGDYGVISNNKLYIEKASYECIIIPPSLSWQSKTIEILDSFKGTIIFIDSNSKKISENAKKLMAGLFEKENFIKIPDTNDVIAETIQNKIPRKVTVTMKDGSLAKNILINHRFDAAAHIVFVSSPQTEESQEIIITVNALGGAVELDTPSGRAYRYSSEIKDGKTFIETVLPPHGSRIFIIDQTQTSVEPIQNIAEETSFIIEGPYSFKPLTDNCLTIDKCTLQMDGRLIAQNESVSVVKKLIWEKTGLSDFMGYQPWALKENNIRTRTNKTVLTFSFSVIDKPGTIALAMETSDRFNVEINGNKIDFTPGRWFIDRRIRVLNLEDHIAEGENIIKASTDYLWDTEIENIYIIGDFAVGPKEDGFPVKKMPETLEKGDWGIQGFPFYAGSILYKMSFPIVKDADARYEIDISEINVTVTGIRINDEEVGVVPFSPFRGDITSALKDGENNLELELTGSNTNVFHSYSSENSDFMPYGIIGSPRLVVLK